MSGHWRLSWAPMERNSELGTHGPRWLLGMSQPVTGVHVIRGAKLDKWQSEGGYGVFGLLLVGGFHRHCLLAGGFRSYGPTSSLRPPGDETRPDRRWATRMSRGWVTLQLETSSPSDCSQREAQELFSRTAQQMPRCQRLSAEKDPDDLVGSSREVGRTVR